MLDGVARIVLIEPLTARGIELTDFDGVRHRLADRAGKPVLVVAWTGNSSHSRALLSMLADVDLNELGQVLAIAGRPARDGPFAKELGAPYPTAWALGNDADYHELVRRFGDADDDAALDALSKDTAAIAAAARTADQHDGHSVARSAV